MATGVDKGFMSGPGRAASPISDPCPVSEVEHAVGCVGERLDAVLGSARVLAGRLNPVLSACPAEPKRAADVSASSSVPLVADIQKLGFMVCELSGVIEDIQTRLAL